jgi:hypothetical protein
MNNRKVAFARRPGGFLVRETKDEKLEAVYLASYEKAFRMMTDLQNEGFREVSTSSVITRKSYVYVK